MAVATRNAKKKMTKRPPRRPNGRASTSRAAAHRRGKLVAGRPGRRLSNKTHLPRITYASLSLTEDDHSKYEAAVVEARANLDAHYKNFIRGQWVDSSDGKEQAHASPADTRLNVSNFPRATREDTQAAIRAARAAAVEWGATPYGERVKILRRAADLMVERVYELSAQMAFEVGKPRGEAIAEVNESAELIRYYCDQIEANEGFTRPLESPGPGQTTMSVLRPYGVWGVVSPWNFPLALCTGMSSGALVAGNAVVFKPASESPVMGYQLTQAYADAGIPTGVFNLVVGPGSTVGEELLANADVDGLIFTGSKEVGMHLYKNFVSKYPKPVITEMGGKNPVIVTANADLDEAAEGVMRAAFGFAGQKCSATSRVYVEASIKAPFLERLLDYTQKRVKVGNPTERDVFMGPVINQGAVDTWSQAVEAAMRSGGRIVHGGNRVREGDLQYGYYVEPTIVDGLPNDHRLFKEELFVPFVTIGQVNSIEEALREANDVEYGLCAGIYTEDPHELQYFYDNIQAGVLYVNRRSGATTGAWPGINSFGGWKGSGSSGKSGLGPYYVQQFMREQSRWVVED